MQFTPASGHWDGREEYNIKSDGTFFPGFEERILFHFRYIVTHLSSLLVRPTNPGLFLSGIIFLHSVPSQLFPLIAISEGQFPCLVKVSFTRRGQQDDLHRSFPSRLCSPSTSMVDSSVTKIIRDYFVYRNVPWIIGRSLSFICRRILRSSVAYPVCRIKLIPKSFWIRA